VVALGEDYARSTLLNTSMLLPGPTGERNTLSFAPRGNVWCAASSTAALLNQLAAVFATGNKALLAPESEKWLPAGLPQDIRSGIRVARPDDGIDMHAALIDQEQFAQAAPSLANRHGSLVPLVDTREQDAIALWRLVAERALCVNTTAAGGNASLMTLGA
jgi:RHH-type transcriptional regulator, proline utilization regulon repressor / proline dehydrogenase / delta 1-pyrroline-5-carboxylate dehydrogenase